MIYALLSLVLILLVLVLVGLMRLVGRMELIQEDVSAIRMRTVPVDAGGRLAPSMADLAAAKNRMNAMGVAQVGTPDG